MSFWGAFLALLWDQVSPLYHPSQFDRLAGRWADWVHRNVNAGTRRHGILVWCIGALLPAVLVGLVGALLHAIAYLLGVLWGALVLYQLLGFKQLAHQAGQAKDALLAGDQARCLAVLREMGLDPADDADATDLNLQAVEQVLLLGLGRTFGTLFWFAVLGSFGAVGYALTFLLAARWRDESDFPAPLEQVLELLDWLPTRLLAFCFAVVGNFDETLMRWRGLNPVEARSNSAVLRATGFGALGLDEAAPEPDYVSGAANLLKRSALLWLGILALLWLGGL